ncbi:hypothetical protein CDAR_261891 [Caerostris darwini]|uniref:Uncharacterized protein n=1 Tax=Caerostris darwini TaxID=1538125 RepID=A0AAV4TE93_9ARAC|nr:hypothetical protein CDAR_522801 [Caerostris darwini]GIY63888.1 hypothetical protein CDAR_261891 [Caerostris darwini]
MIPRNPVSMTFESVNAGLMNPSSMNESFKRCWLPDMAEKLKYNTKVHVLRCRIRLFHFRPEKSTLSFPDNPQYAGTLRIEIQSDKNPENRLLSRIRAFMNERHFLLLSGVEDGN